MLWFNVYKKNIFKNNINIKILKKTNLYPIKKKKWKYVNINWDYNLIINYFIKNGKKINLINELIKFFLLLQIYNINKEKNFNFFFFSSLFINENFLIPVFFRKSTKIIKKKKKKNYFINTSKINKKLFDSKLIYCQPKFRLFIIKKFFIFFSKLLNLNFFLKLYFSYNIFKNNIKLINNFIYNYNKKAMNLLEN